MCTTSAHDEQPTPDRTAAASLLPTTGVTASAQGELIVFAAASLRGAFEAFEPEYEAAAGVDLVYSFDASSFLRTQIEEGAPADVFASADTVNAQALLDAALATDPVAFACNQLTVIVPAANPAGIETVEDLAADGIRIVAAAEDVPITRYATQVVEALGITEGYEANIVSEEDNVAAVRAKIELGEGDAAIVYVTDAMASGEAVIEVAIRPEANVPATYAAVAVVGSDQPDESQAFLDWLVGPEGQGTLAVFGFLPARPST